MMTIYPKAAQAPLTDHSSPGVLAQRKRLVLHVTAGPSAQSAINTFRASKAPGRVSAHFVIDRDDDATVFQLLPCEDTAWHARAANQDSIGIEHAAIPGNPQYAITEAQYEASAALVAWLCSTLNIPCDRIHVQGHNEASPQDGHVGCCEPTLSVDRVVTMAQALMEPAQ
jgi:N-acetyl-anhydromuramyl-L-alanine amidase AmpD